MTSLPLNNASFLVLDNLLSIVCRQQGYPQNTQKPLKTWACLDIVGRCENTTLFDTALFRFTTILLQT